MPDGPHNFKTLYPDIRRLPPDQVGAAIRSTLQTASSSQPTDMDRAALLGTKARSLDRSVIEPEVADFASQSASPQKKEVVAWFLSAFWTPDSEPDGALVRLLCDWFESAPPPAADVRDALILALAAAYPAKIDPALKQKIYRIFQSLDSIANQKRQESVIVAAVQRVLRSK